MASTTASDIEARMRDLRSELAALEAAQADAISDPESDDGLADDWLVISKPLRMAALQQAVVDAMRRPTAEPHLS